MLNKIEEILGRKQVKYFLLVISIIGFLFCVIIMLTQIIDIIVEIVETKILHRKLEDINKWKNYLFESGYSSTIFFVIMWYFFIKKKFIASSLFLLSTLCIYLYTYKLFALNHYNRDLLRFPFFVLLTVFAVHVVINRRNFYFLINKLEKHKPLLARKQILSSSSFTFICGGLLGALFFLYIFGAATLDFTYVDWLMAGGDLTQHYLGWKLFRNSSWYFPLGLMDNIVYPFKISIIYTDSIPLFAIIFKLLSPVLPDNFQYFGLFGIICYALQGGIGALVIRKIGGNNGQSIIGSLFFTMSTVMMHRIYEHISLSAHFIILLCILIYLQNNNFNLKKQVFIWSGLLALSASIHLYFIPMVMIFMFFRLLREYIITKNIINQCIVFSVSVLVLTGTMFSFGAFYFVKDFIIFGLGEASANFNAFVNPMDMGISQFIKNMPLANISFPAEGYAYLGLGIILFVTIIMFDLCQRKNVICHIVEKEKVLPILGVILSFILFSLSPTITFNQYKLFTYPVPLPVERLWSIFRSTGRMIWPVIYIIMTVCIWWAIKNFSAKKSILVLSVFLLIQWADLKPWFVSKGNAYKTKITWQTELSSPVWNNLANEYKHIFFMGDTSFLYPSLYSYLCSFLDLAGNHKITVNDAYLARTNSRLINDNKQKEAAYLINNGPKDDMIYVFQDNEQASLFKEAGIHFFIIDEVIIGINSEKTYLDNYRF